MNVKVIIWIALVILLLIMVVKCENSTVEEEVVVEPEQVEEVTEEIVANQTAVEEVTGEIVANQTAVSVTSTVDDYIELTGAVLFAHNSAELSDDGKAVIDERIAKYRGKVQNTMDIEVIGYADITGNAAYNQKLSLKRAQAVADYIEVQTDIPHTEIRVTGMGSSESGVDMSLGAEESQALDRRVVVHFQGVLIQ